MKHLLRLSDLSTDEIRRILELAESCRQGGHLDAAQGRIIANCFFEPSTRTQYSFNTAELKLGMQVISFNPQASSMTKGETFYDTVRTFESFGIDAIVIRSAVNGWYDELLGHVAIPILNAGEGTLNHPTQQLLDLMTIYQEFGHFEGLKIAICGDIKYSRVAHADIDVMQRLGMECRVAGPAEYQDPQYPGIDFDEAVRDMDILMMLRVQNERHDERMTLSKEEYHAHYGLSAARAALMKPGAIIMHPAPFNRGYELADEVVECPQSRIFRQIENGVFVRMAVILRSLELDRG